MANKAESASQMHLGNKTPGERTNSLFSCIEAPRHEVRSLTADVQLTLQDFQTPALEVNVQLQYPIGSLMGRKMEEKRNSSSADEGKHKTVIHRDSNHIHPVCSQSET